MPDKRKLLARWFAVPAALAATVALVAASSSSTNFVLEQQSRPQAAGQSSSANFGLAGMSPQSPAGADMVSANFRVETVLVPDTYDPIDTTAPVITGGPTVTYLGDDRALVEWQTDELADGFIEYGLTTAYGSVQPAAPGYRTAHQVLVTGLPANTSHEFRVGSTDRFLNGPTLSANDTFITAAAPDATAPTIQNIAVTFISLTEVRIDFDTTEPASTNLEHGPTPALGSSLPDALFRTSHTRSINGLSPGVQHHFDTTATDPSGNSALAGPQSFTMPVSVGLTTSALPDGRVGNLYSAFVTAANGVGAYTFAVSSGTLPAGLALNPATGEIAGTPTAAGVSSFDVTVTDSGSPASFDNAAYIITVSAAKKKDSGGDEEGCSTSGRGGAAWLALLAAALGGLALRPRRV